MSLNAICVEKRNSVLKWFSLAPRKVRLLTNVSLRVQVSWQCSQARAEKDGARSRCLFETYVGSYAHLNMGLMGRCN